MKDDYLRIRMSKRRMDKLRLYATMKDTTMTHVIEDLIDAIKIPEIGHQGAVPVPALTDGQHRSGDAP